MSDHGIYKRPDSRYWWAAYADASGKATRRSTGVRIDLDPRGTEARRVRHEFLMEVAPLEDKPADQWLWEELAEAYIPELKKGIRPSTFNRYKAGMRVMAARFSGTPALTTGPQVKAWIRDQVNAGYAASTINIKIAIMQGMYSWAIKELDWDIQNPWASRSLSTDNERNRYLSQDEVDRLMESAKECATAYYLVDYLTLALNTGFRPQELLKMTWDRVNLEEGTFVFEKPKAKNVAADQKNGRYSVIPINANARRALISRMETQKQNAAASRWVFSNRAGHRLKDVGFAFREAVKRAGLEDVQQRDLRRTFASRLVQAEVPLQAVSELLRHADIRITDRVYAHLSTEHLKAAAAVLDTPPKLKVVSRSK
jgi:integrase